MTALYKIVYGKTTDGIVSLYQRSYKDYLVDEWLKEHRKGSYYHHPGWTMEKFIEVERSEDATWFALRWS
jgi:hypothetical protein